MTLLSVASLFYILWVGKKGLETVLILFSMVYLCSVTIPTPWNARGSEGEAISSC